MILVQAFFSFAISLLSLNTSSASSNSYDAGNVPANRVNLPQGSRTAINRAPPIAIRHRGNRVVAAVQTNPKKNITKHALSKKIIKRLIETFNFVLNVCLLIVLLVKWHKILLRID